MRPKLVVLAVLALVTVACADAPTGARSNPSGSGIVHPTGADQVVLRVALEGGFVAPETTFARMPSFSVMGDGTIIEPGAQDDLSRAGASPAARSHDLRGRDPGDPRRSHRRGPR
jgi:hypothetical protein